MDTNLFSLFGANDSDEQNTPKKQTAKKKSAKGKHQTAVDLFSFDADEAEILENDATKEAIKVTNEENFTTTLFDTNSTNNTEDPSLASIDTKELQTIENPLAETIVETHKLSNNQEYTEITTDAISTDLTNNKNIVTKETFESENTTESIENTIGNSSSEITHFENVTTDETRAQETNAKPREFTVENLPTDTFISEVTTTQEESIETANFDDKINELTESTIATEETRNHNTENNISIFQIEPTQEIEETEVTAPEPTLEEFLSNLETSTEESAVDVLEKQYLQEVIVSDYSMFMNPSKPSNVLDKLPNRTTELNETEDASLPEWALTKKYYSIGEVATLFDVNTSHIRFWSKEFNFRLRTTRKGDRMYTPEDIQKLRLIHELVKVKKHTIKGAKEILNTKTQKVSQTVDLKDNLKELKNMLLGIQNKL